MEITASMVKDLRSETGAGIMDCKKALQEVDGDLEKAVEWLRTKGLKTAEKKSKRSADEGLIGSYIHHGGQIGVLIELNCETDFVARTDEFQELLKNMTLQIAASSPLFVSRDDVDPELLEKEKKILRAQAEESGKPDHIIDKIVEGRLGKFYEEVCLMEQPYVRDPEKKVENVIKEHIATLGENIEVRRFVRYELGEDLE